MSRPIEARPAQKTSGRLLPEFNSRGPKTAEDKAVGATTELEKILRQAGFPQERLEFVINTVYPMLKRAYTESASASGSVTGGRQPGTVSSEPPLARANTVVEPSSNIFPVTGPMPEPTGEENGNGSQMLYTRQDVDIVVKQVVRIIAEDNLGGIMTKPDFGLTPRELGVIPLIASGLTNGEIGSRLFMSPNTVKNHVSSILQKLGSTSRTDAAVQAVRTGIIE